MFFNYQLIVRGMDKVTDDEVVVESFGMIRRLSRDRAYAGGLEYVPASVILISRGSCSIHADL